MIKVNFIEKITYFLLMIGLIIDQSTTFIGINYYGLYETNIIAKRLMDLGLWHICDLLICILFIVSLRIILNKYKKFNYILVLPMFSGFIRLLVGFSNLILIYSLA